MRPPRDRKWPASGYTGQGGGEGWGASCLQGGPGKVWGGGWAPRRLWLTEVLTAMLRKCRTLPCRKEDPPVKSPE